MRASVAVPTPVRAPVDPRIRRRRVEVRREAGRRRLRVLVGATTLSAMVAGGWGALHSPLLDVDRVEVVGAARLAPADVLAAAAVARGTAMVDVDRTAVARRVEGLGWAGAVDVRLRWPGTVEVTVAERTAVAVTSPDGHRWSLLDRNGRVLAEAGSPPPGLVVVRGVAAAGVGPGRVVADAPAPLAVATALPASLRPEVAAVVAGPGGIELELVAGGVARLGAAERIPEKLRALQTVLTRAPSGGVTSIDLRQPSSPALTRREPSRTVSTLSTG